MTRRAPPSADDPVVGAIMETVRAQGETIAELTRRLDGTTTRLLALHAGVRAAVDHAHRRLDKMDGTKPAQPPRHWIKIETALEMIGDARSGETVRLWCEGGAVLSKKYKNNVWYLCPVSFAARAAELGIPLLLQTPSVGDK